MNILQIRSSFEDSGPGTQSLTLAVELKKRGHNVLFAAAESLMQENIERAGFKFKFIEELAIKKRNPTNVFNASIKVGRLIKKNNIDVIHSHNAASTFISFFAKIMFGLNIRIVRSVRGVEERSSYSWRNWVYRFYPGKLLAVCEYTKQRLISLGVSSSKILVTYNGVNINRFDKYSVDGFSIRERYKVSSNDILLGHVGAFSGWKGQDKLVDALSILSKEFENIKVIFVGDGAFRQKVEQKVAQLEVSNKVNFAGLTMECEKYHAAFDIYTQPSTMGEMFPNSIIESMAMGNPWVGSNLSGLPEQTAAGKAGLIGKPGCIEDLVQNLRSIIVDFEKRKAMGKAAYDEVMSKFTIDKVVDRVEASYYE